MKVCGVQNSICPDLYIVKCSLEKSCFVFHIRKWVNDDRNLIFGWTIPWSYHCFSSSSSSFRCWCVDVYLYIGVKIWSANCLEDEESEYVCADSTVSGCSRRDVDSLEDLSIIYPTQRCLSYACSCATCSVLSRRHVIHSWAASLCLPLFLSHSFSH